MSVASSLMEERFRRTVLASEAWLVTKRRAMTMEEKEEEEEKEKEKRKGVGRSKK